MTSMRTEKALEVQGISKRYGAVQAVDDLSFTVQAGEILGLLGPKGAGKTTTIRMILDIIKPSGGQVSVLGGPMTEAKKSRIGYLPEERGLYEDMTVLDTLLFLGQLKGLSRQTARARAETVALVENGQARAVLVLADDVFDYAASSERGRKKRDQPVPAVEERLAAEELRDHLRKMSGATLEIVPREGSFGGRLPFFGDGFRRAGGADQIIVIDEFVATGNQ